MATEQDESSLLANCLTIAAERSFSCWCFVLLQLTARLDVLDEHLCFPPPPPPDLADDTGPFSPEESAPFTPPSFRGRDRVFGGALSSSDQFLAQHDAREEPAESSNSYSSLTEIGTRLSLPDEPAEALHYQQVPAMSLEDIGNIEILIKVK